jgi:hypothetical protein
MRQKRVECVMEQKGLKPLLACCTLYNSLPFVIFLWKQFPRSCSLPSPQEAATPMKGKQNHCLLVSLFYNLRIHYWIVIAFSLLIFNSTQKGKILDCFVLQQ